MHTRMKEKKQRSARHSLNFKILCQMCSYGRVPARSAYPYRLPDYIYDFTMLYKICNLQIYLLY